MTLPRMVDHLFSSPEGEDFRVAEAFLKRSGERGVSGTLWVDARAGEAPGGTHRPLPWTRPRGLKGLPHRLRRHRLRRRREAALSGRAAGLGWVHPVRSSREIRYDPTVMRGELLHVHQLHDAMLDWEIFFPCLPPGHPVVWTLYDAHALTGGCTDPGGCERYRKRCERCPLLRDPGPHDLAAEGFDLKARLYPNLDLHLVASTPHLRDLADRSPLGGLARSVHTIALPHPRSLAEFLSAERDRARELFGIPPEACLVVARAADLLRADARTRPWREALERLAARGEIRLTLYGEADLVQMAHVPGLIWLGPIPDATWTARALALGDLFCFPSPTDEYPRPVVEAQAAGTPVLSVRHPSLSGRVVHERSGWLTRSLDLAELEAAVRGALAWWRANASASRRDVREGIRREVDPEARTADYLDLYAEVCPRRRPDGPEPPRRDGRLP